MSKGYYSCEDCGERFHDSNPLVAHRRECRFVIKGNDAPKPGTFGFAIKQRDIVIEQLRAELAELRARVKEVPRTTEWHIAMREANQIHDADAYFAARSEMLDSGHNRHLFEAGYQRGFDAGEKVYAGTAAAAVAEAVAKDAAGIWMRKFVDAVEHEAFNMRAPNTHTPVLVGMCIEARRSLLAAAPVPDDVEKDAERLDWLVSEVALVQSLAISPPHGDGTTRYYIVWPEYGEEQRDTYATPREAIDAAILAADTEGRKDE